MTDSTTSTSSSTASTPSLVSLLGAGSGIDMTALAANLANAQFASRNQILSQRDQTLTAQISTASTLKNELTSLSSALADRVRTGDLAVTPSVANASVATASSPSGTSGSGSYTLEVESLASAQVLASPAYASATGTVGSGTLTIRFGSTTSGGFTENASQSPLTVAIAPGATLADVATAINAAKGGVTAYVAQTAQGAQLVMKGSEGEDNGFVVEADETPGDPGLSTLAWNPSAGGDPSRLIGTSADAKFRLDGLEMTSPGNTTGTVAPGLTLNLTGTNAGAPTKIAFSTPTDAIGSALDDLVSALNTVVGDLSSALDANSGDLAGDTGARALGQALSALTTTVIMPNAASGSPRTLADLGVSIQRDGTFQLDTGKLASVMASDPAGAAAMFTNGLYGIYATVDKVVRNATSTTDPGSLGGSIARYTRLDSDTTDQIGDLATQQETLRQTLLTRFSKTDTQITSYQSTLSFLKAQIASWNSSNDG